jgi:hypothetical protein
MKQVTLGQARSKENRGNTVRVCPSNIHPDNIWGACSMVRGIELTKQFINSFKYYNCNEETGHKINYYIVE